MATLGEPMVEASPSRCSLMQPIPPELRREVAKMVRHLHLSPIPVWRWRIGLEWRKRYESVFSDVLHFHYQTKELKQRSLPQYAALFKDDGPTGDPLAVLVQVPDLHSLSASYDRFLHQLRESEFPLEQVAPEQAESIFVDRLSEFLAVQFTFAGQASAPTIVNSNRKGDTVLYAKGYFTSTGTAFGVSNPAEGILSPARYSFGIIDSGRHRFEDVVWTCPTTVRLDLP